MNKLYEARDILATSWCRGDYKVVDADGVARFCAVGAIGEAMHDGTAGYVTTGKSPEVKVLAEVIKEHYFDRTKVKYPDADFDSWSSEDWVITFNDTVAETHDEVMAMFEKAAIKFDEQVNVN